MTGEQMAVAFVSGPRDGEFEQVELPISGMYIMGTVPEAVADEKAPRRMRGLYERVGNLMVWCGWQS